MPLPQRSPRLLLYLGVATAMATCAAPAAAAGGSGPPPAHKVRAARAVAHGGRQSRATPTGAKKGKRLAQVKRSGRSEKAPTLPSHIDLLSLDLSSGLAQVEVLGGSRQPEARLFVFSDDMQRRFVPSMAECQPAPAAGAAAAPTAAAAAANAAPAVSTDSADPAPARWLCALTIPRIYRRTLLVSLAIEWGDKEVPAPSGRVAALWAAARAAAPLPMVPDRPRDPGAPWHPPLPRPDGGTLPTPTPTIERDELDHNERNPESSPEPD